MRAVEGSSGLTSCLKGSRSEDTIADHHSPLSCEGVTGGSGGEVDDDVKGLDWPLAANFLSREGFVLGLVAPS